MQSKKSSLEKFLDSYLNKNRAISGAKSFSAYKRQNGINYEDKYNTALQNAYSGYKKSLDSYGKNAEEAYTSGISRSGYREYLQKQSRDSYKSKLQELLSEKQKDELSSLSGYMSYLEDYKKKTAALKKSVSSQLLNSGVANRDVAYEYAISAGLSSDDAAAVSNSVYRLMREKIIANVLEKITTYRLDANGAILLAKKYGLSDEDAESIGNEAREYLEQFKASSDSYLDYLEKQADKTTVTY